LCNACGIRHSKTLSDAEKRDSSLIDELQDLMMPVESACQPLEQHIPCHHRDPKAYG
jgi:hypothetical protein